MNCVAEQQIKIAKVVRIVDRRLSAVDHTARTLLSQVIGDAITDEASLPAGGNSLALPGSDTGLVATILPLNRGERRSPSGPAAAIFVQDPTVAPPYPGEAFAKLYGLTGAELRVLLALTPGLSVKDAAAMLGVGEVTARTHLQHIYAKTGTSKQTELLNLFRNAAPPVKVG